MKNKLILFSIAIIGSFACWQIIDFFIVELPLWKYILIETIIVITKMFYDTEKIRLNGQK
jgi:hypothetical protein